MLGEQAVPKGREGHAEKVAGDLVDRGAVGMREAVEDVRAEGRPAIAPANPMTSLRPMSPWRLLDGGLQAAVADFHSGMMPSHTGQVCEGPASCVEAAARQDCDLNALGHRGEEGLELDRNAAGPGVASHVARRLTCSCRQVAWDRNRRR